MERQALGCRKAASSAQLRWPLLTASKLLAEWFWTDRWMGSSAFLLPIEPRGLYREMLTQAWRRGCRLPASHEAIQRAVGCTRAEWNRCWPVISSYWRKDGDAIVNDTQLEVWAETLAAHERAVERGSKGGKARAQALAQARAQAEAQGVDTGKPPSPSPDERSKKQDRSTGAREPSAVSDPKLADRAGRFVHRYAELFAEHRKGAKYHSKPSLDFQEAIGLCQTWDDERLERLAIAFLTTDDKFCRNSNGSIASFRSRASWCDTRLRESGL